jgi:nitrogen fixation protein NifU and related proteins
MSNLMNQMQLYQQVILHHNRHPKNFRKIEPCTHQAEGHNPLCGDHFSVYLNINKDSVIEEIGFHGNGCAISKSSASLMTEIIKNKSIEEAKYSFTKAQEIFTGNIKEKDNSKIFTKLSLFANLSRYPTRIKCASLAWHAMKSALENKTIVSTE